MAQCWRFLGRSADGLEDLVRRFVRRSRLLVGFALFGVYGRLVICRWVSGRRSRGVSLLATRYGVLPSVLVGIRRRCLESWLATVALTGTGHITLTGGRGIGRVGRNRANLLTTPVCVRWLKASCC